METALINEQEMPIVMGDHVIPFREMESSLTNAAMIGTGNDRQGIQRELLIIDVTWSKSDLLTVDVGSFMSDFRSMDPSNDDLSFDYWVEGLVL